MATAIHITDDSFTETVLNSKVPALVDFWAVWCNPCKMIAPIVEEIAAENEGALLVTKLDVDTNPITPGHYGVQGIPTLILFVDGQPVERIVGFKPKEKLMATLRPFLKSR